MHNCKTTNFKIYKNILTSGDINNIINNPVFQQQVQQEIINILSLASFSLVLEPGTLRINDNLFWDYYPEEVGVDLKGNNGKTLVWKNDIYSVYNTTRLIFWADQSNSYTDAGGNPLATPVEVRVIQSPPGVNYSYLQANISTNAYNNYVFRGTWDATTNINSDGIVMPAIPSSSAVGRAYKVIASGTQFSQSWSVGDLIVVNGASLNDYVNIPAAQIALFLQPGAVLGIFTVSTTGVHQFTFPKPLIDSILYVHFRRITPLIPPYVSYDDTEIHGLRIDLYY
jgi:hypothetical protein